MKYDKECREIGCDHYARNGNHRLHCPKHPAAGKIDPYYEKMVERELKKERDELHKNCLSGISWEDHYFCEVCGLGWKDKSNADACEAKHREEKMDKPIGFHGFFVDDYQGKLEVKHTGLAKDFMPMHMAEVSMLYDWLTKVITYHTWMKAQKSLTPERKIEKAKKFLNDLDDHAGYTPSKEILHLRKILGMT